MLTYMKKNQNKCYSLAKKKWGHVMEQLQKVLVKHNRKSYHDTEKIPPSERMANKVKSMIAEFGKFIMQAVVLGYNNSSYDNNLVRCHLFTVNKQKQEDKQTL